MRRSLSLYSERKYMVRPWIAERAKLWNPVKWKNQFAHRMLSPNI